MTSSRQWEVRSVAGVGLAGVVAVVFGASVHAQVMDHGVREDAFRSDQLHQRRLDERQRDQRAAIQRVPDVFDTSSASETLPDWPDTESPCFVVQYIVLEGDASVDFAWALAPLTQTPTGALGRCLGTDGLGVVAGRVQQRLIERGFVTTRVLLPPQDLSGGVLTLTLMPGRISAIRFMVGASERATWRNAVPARVGDILNLRDIEQALENFKRVPTVEADIQIVPGSEPGQSELHVHWAQRSAGRLNLSFDDSGPRSTGRYQASATVSLDHGLALNDLFYVTRGRDLGGGEPGPRGSRNASLHYSLPLGYWTVALDASRGSYHQTVAGATQNYVYSGDSAVQEISVARLIHRDARSKTTVRLKAFARRSGNHIDDAELEPQRRRVGGWELSAEHRRQVGSAQWDASLAFKRGTGAFGSLEAPEEAFGEGTSRFALVNLELQWTQPLELAGTPWKWTSRWRGQRERTPLTPQDHFSIGGRHSVRGFDGELTLAAERGWWWRNELGIPLAGDEARFYVGMDMGRIGGPSAQWLAGRYLVGRVMGLRGDLGPLHYDVFMGRPWRKPQAMRAAGPVAGFQLSASF